MGCFVSCLFLLVTAYFPLFDIVMSLTMGADGLRIIGVIWCQGFVPR